ncbi:MAG: ABC transporter substrate-binding protein [Candidatus Binatia bacterium]
MFLPRFSWRVLVLAGLFLSSVQASEWKDKAEIEGKLTWYASLGAADARRIIDRFKELYPKIDAQFYRAGDAQLIERILVESRARRFDWDVVSTTGYYIYNLKKRGMLASYDSPERQFIRAGHKDAQATWTSIYTNYTVLGYNSRRVSKDQVPKSHTDLLKPAWKGQVGLVQTAYEWFAVMLHGMGHDKGAVFMRELAKQQPQLRNGRTLLAQLVAAGEVNSGLAAYSQNFENLKREGAPVDWAALDPVYGNLNPMGLSAQAPRPNAGKLFIDFVLSKAGQEIIRAQRRVPDRVDVLPDPPKLAQGFTAVFTPDEVYADFDRYVKLFQEIFGTK